jgi:glucose-1-phosphate thymidylyltransferase
MNLPIIGLIPAGGTASRLGTMPCSKELIPIPSPIPNHLPEPVSQRLIRAYCSAGAQRISWILRHGKWDIPAYFGSGQNHGIPMDYSVMHYPYGPPFTLFQAFPLFQNHLVLLGFPDILLNHPNPFSPLVHTLRENPGIDVALGTVTATDPSSVDIIHSNEYHFVTHILPKPDNPTSSIAWIWAAWKPAFSHFLENFIRQKLEQISSLNTHLTPIPEIHIGHTIHHFIQSGGQVKAVHFPNTQYLDIGTPSGYNNLHSFIHAHHHLFSSEP